MSCFFLIQAPCQVELENWVNSIHSACAAAFARHRGKTGTLHLLQEEIFRLEKSIESVRPQIKVDLILNKYQEFSKTQFTLRKKMTKIFY